MVIATVAAIGALLTVIACVRMIMALVRNEPRETVMGWFALMLIVGVAVFAIDKVFS